MRSEDGRAVKKTWPGFYGQIPVWREGKADRLPALPSEYIERQMLQNEVFGSDIRLEGINLSSKPSMIIGEPSGQPSFVISQGFVDAADTDAPSPTMVQIEKFLTRHGFAPLPGSYFGWLRRADGVVILDARPDNFILATDGVVVIDLQMAKTAAP